MSDKTKGCLSRQTALAMVYKLAKSAERSWRRLDGSERLAQVIQGVRFRDGEPVQAAEEQTAACPRTPTLTIALVRAVILDLARRSTDPTHRPPSGMVPALGRDDFLLDESQRRLPSDR